MFFSRAFGKPRIWELVPHFSKDETQAFHAFPDTHFGYKYLFIAFELFQAYSNLGLTELCKHHITAYSTICIKVLLF